MVEIAGEAASQLSDDGRSRYESVAWRELMGVRVVLAPVGDDRVDRLP